MQLDKYDSSIVQELKLTKINKTKIVTIMAERQACEFVSELNWLYESKNINVTVKLHEYGIEFKLIN